MKRQFFATALMGISMLAAPMAIQSASAQTAPPRDIEPNSSTSNPASDRGLANGRPVFYSGNISSRDTADVYSIVTPDGIRNISLSVKRPSPVFWELYEDRNRNRRIDSGDRRILINRNEDDIKVPADRTSYLLRFKKIRTNSGGSYKATLIGSGASFRDVLLTIHRAKALSRFDPKIPFSKKDRADFYAEAALVGGTPRVRTKTVKDNNAPVFNRRRLIKISPNKNEVIYDLKLFDDDFSRSKDQADINPSSSSKTMRVKYIPLANKVVDANGKFLGRGGQVITVTGDSRSKKASLSFSIRHSDPR